MDFKPGAKREKDIKVASQLFYMHLTCPSGPVFHWTGLDAHGSMILSTTSSIQKMPRSDKEKKTTTFWKAQQPDSGKF